MPKKNPTVKAMMLHNLYRKNFVHSLEDLKADPKFGQWWAEMDNYNRTYVLTGRS